MTENGLIWNPGCIYLFIVNSEIDWEDPEVKCDTVKDINYSKAKDEVSFRLSCMFI